jgi:DNA modification methylase
LEKRREKLIAKKDPKKLATEELISIIIGCENSKSHVYELSKDVTDFLRTKLSDTLGLEELKQVEGIDETKAIQIISSLELGRRFYINSISKKLSNEDWDFLGLKQSERQYGVHFFHHYTAKFIPQIPSKLIQRLSKGNEIVVDPFMGSGTTIVEAKLLGCHSYGFDTNPLAVKIAKAKTMQIDENKIKEIDLFLNWIAHKRKYHKVDELNIDSPTLFKDSNLWFRDDVEKKIKLILLESKKYSPESQNFIEVGLSDLLKGMSNARMDSIEPVLPENQIYIDRKHYYREVNNLSREIPVYGRLYSQLKRMKHAILEFNKETDNKLICKSILGDAREMTKFVKHCNLVVTSPPYWSAQNYEKLHMLSFKLFNLQTERGKEIGRNRALYLSDMKMVFMQIAKILKGYLAIVIGEDHKRKQHEKLFNIVKEIGFKPFDIVTRRISNQASNAKQIKNEFIYIFKS